jgi:uncharacterized membrane protein
VALIQPVLEPAMPPRRWIGQLFAYINASLWVVPVIAIPTAVAISRPLHWLDAALGWSAANITVAGATAMYQAVISATLSFTVFVFASLLVAIQIASAQMTPRIIGTMLLRAPIPKFTVALFIFTLVFAMSALNRMDTTVHQLVAFSIASLCICCFAAFFYLIDYSSRMLRPVSVLKNVGDIGINVIRNVYPNLSLGFDAPQITTHSLGQPDQFVLYRGTSAIVLSVDIPAIVAEAQRFDSVIEFVPQVGDFVAAEEPLFAIYGGGGKIDEHVLLEAVRFGSERTMEQDPTFAFRIVVDIALKALSPAINDPTTAVLAIDQLQRMLRVLGKRHLRTDAVEDQSGRLRVIFRTPNWEDFVHLTFCEIRASGSRNLQIVRRFRAMMLDLLRNLPAHRHPAVVEAMDLLDREMERSFAFPEDLKLGRIADTQGLGGSSNIGAIRTYKEQLDRADAGHASSEQGNTVRVIT